jgi:hypothetical protein
MIERPQALASTRVHHVQGEHCARADAAERQVVLTHLHGRLVDADAAGENLGDVPVCEMLVVGERIERERAVVRIEVGDDLFGLARRLDRQKRPEDLFFHGRPLVVHPDDDVRGELEATGIELPIRREIEERRPARPRTRRERSEVLAVFPESVMTPSACRASAQARGEP